MHVALACGSVFEEDFRHKEQPLHPEVCVFWRESPDTETVDDVSWEGFHSALAVMTS